MSFFKKLFGKKEEPEWKKRAHSAPEEKPKKEEIEKPTPPEPTKIPPVKSIEEQEKEMQEGIHEMFKESESGRKLLALNAMAKSNQIKDEDLIKASMDKIFPRLKRGQIENATGQKMIVPTKDGEKEVEIPDELIMAGYDSGPDFFTSFAIDTGQMFTMIYRKHITLSGMTKEALLQHACQNFLKKIGPSSRVTQTIFPGVYQLQTDGNSEATTFLFPNTWKTVQDQLKLSKLFLVMPAQNTVLFWESISDETFKDLKEKVTATVKTYPQGSIVSNHLYELRNEQFYTMEKVFDIEI